MGFLDVVDCKSKIEMLSLCLILGMMMMMMIYTPLAHGPPTKPLIATTFSSWSISSFLFKRIIMRNGRTMRGKFHARKRKKNGESVMFTCNQVIGTARPTQADMEVNRD